MPTKAQSGRCDGPAFVGGHNEEVQGNRISFDASRRIIGNKSIGVQGFGTVCTSKKSPTTKSNIGAISSTIQQHHKAIQVTSYTNVQQHLKKMYIFCEQFFLCFRLVYLNCSIFHTQVYEEGSKYHGSPRIDENIRQGPLKGSPVAFNTRGPSKGSPMAFRIVSEITNARRLSPRFAGQERHGKTKVTSELCFFNSTHKQFYGRTG